MLDTLGLYLQYPFVRRALIVGALISLCASLLGNVLVHRRLSLLGDGLSHVAFGAFSIAGVLPLAEKTPFVLGVTLVSAMLLLRGERRASGDALLSMLSVGILAVGYLLLNLFSDSRNVSVDISDVLFGAFAILTLSRAEVWLCAGLSAATIGFFAVFHNRIFALAFDEAFSQACGVRVRLYRGLMAGAAAVIVVLTMRLVGSLLITALVVFPPLSAMRLCGSYRGVVLLSCLLSLSCTLLGILGAVAAGLPVGAAVVLAHLACFLLCCLMKRILRPAPVLD